MTAGRFIKRGKHTHRDCWKPSPRRHGDIWECDECGRRWKYDHDRRQWLQTWPSTFGLRRRYKVEP